MSNLTSLIAGGGGGTTSGSSTSVGGGNNTYNNIEDFIAVPNVGTKTITITGLTVFTVEVLNVMFGSIKKEDTVTGAITQLPLTTITVAGGIITLNDMADNFLATDNIGVVLVGPDKRADNTLNTNLNTNQNPEYDHYTAANHIINELNKTAGTYRIEVFSDSYKNHAIQLAGSGGVTFKLYATLDPTATTSSVTYWEDVSNTIMGAASLVNSTGLYFVDTAMMPVRFMVEYVLSDATNAIDAFWRKC